MNMVAEYRPPARPVSQTGMAEPLAWALRPLGRGEKRQLWPRGRSEPTLGIRSVIFGAWTLAESKAAWRWACDWAKHRVPRAQKRKFRLTSRSLKIT